MELNPFNHITGGQATYQSLKQVDVAKRQTSARPAEELTRVNHQADGHAQPSTPVEKHSVPTATQAQRQYLNYQRQPEHLRQDWAARVIEAQSARVTGFNDDAIELKPITIESRPSDNIQLFKDIANNGFQHQVIDVYV